LNLEPLNLGYNNLCLFSKKQNIFSNGIKPYQRHFQLARNDSRISLFCKIPDFVQGQGATSNSAIGQKMGFASGSIGSATYLDIYLACGYEFGAC